MSTLADQQPYVPIDVALVDVSAIAPWIADGGAQLADRLARARQPPRGEMTA